MTGIFEDMDIFESVEDYLGRVEDKFAFEKVRRGKGTGPVSRILSGVSLLICVYLLVTLVKDGLYIPALILLLCFTPLSLWIAIGLGIYFLLTRYWIGLILIVLIGGVGWASAWSGMRNVKENLRKGRAEVGPFEGMPILLPTLIFQFVFFALALLTTGSPAIIFWLLFGLATLWEVACISVRLGSPWKGLHYPLMVRYAAIAGTKVGFEQRTGKEIPFKETLCTFARAIYPKWSESEITGFVTSAESKMKKFSDRKRLKEEFIKNNPTIDKKKLKKMLDEVAEVLKGPGEKKGLKVRWLIAEVIERDYGVEERTKYLRAVLLGQAI